jgi:hypothetical protein
MEIVFGRLIDLLLKCGMADLETSANAAWDRAAKIQSSFWSKLWSMEAPKAVATTTSKVATNVVKNIEKRLSGSGSSEKP